MSYRDVMIKGLQNMYRAETEQASQLPKLAAEAQNQNLRIALEEHAQVTQEQAMRLREILDMAGEAPEGEGEVTPGVRGLLNEGQKNLHEVSDPVLRDLALIAAARKMEHYEMACYGTARVMARTAGMEDAARLLQSTLDEEEAADKRLTEIALAIHKTAAQAEPSIAQ